MNLLSRVTTHEFSNLTGQNVLIHFQYQFKTHIYITVLVLIGLRFYNSNSFTRSCIVDDTHNLRVILNCLNKRATNKNIHYTSKSLWTPDHRTHM